MHTQRKANWSPSWVIKTPKLRGVNMQGSALNFEVFWSSFFLIKTRFNNQTTVKTMYLNSRFVSNLLGILSRFWRISNPWEIHTVSKVDWFFFFLRYKTWMSTFHLFFFDIASLYSYWVTLRKRRQLKMWN